MGGNQIKNTKIRKAVTKRTAFLQGSIQTVGPKIVICRILVGSGGSGSSGGSSRCGGSGRSFRVISASKQDGQKQDEE